MKPIPLIGFCATSYRNAEWDRTQDLLQLALTAAPRSNDKYDDECQISRLLYVWLQLGAEEAGHHRHQEDTQDEHRVEQQRQLQAAWSTLE
ncbi:jg15973 [Pararge aegeria aegeria]|uniref:Jg15973 protein n=1 Tax=Pararge aegeria aegeria TaxID=348720 RepID=A0A8S4R433_9NEOP|nr:jg15973 [Pararge aegeria aegeria]